MNVLAIETATDACSVAVSLDGNIVEEFAIIPKQHTRQIFLMLEALLAKNGVTFSQIDVLAFGRGPGSFTGLRIAAAIIQGLAVARDLPIVPISTLHALAEGAYRKYQATQVFSCLDARMNEVYGGYYCFNETTQQMELFSPEFLARPEAVSFPKDFNWLGVGSGCKAYLPILQEKSHFIWQEEMGALYPSAYDVVALAIYRFKQGEYVSAEQALPVYFRDKVTS